MSTAYALHTSPAVDRPTAPRRKATKREMFARRELIARRRKEGRTNLQIAEELGWGNRDTRVGSEVHRMRELGWDVDNRARADPEEMARRKEEAAMMWESGMSAAEISEVLEISESACDSMLFRMRAACEIEPHRETPPRAGPVQAAIASMAARGDTNQEIADRMQTTPSSVSATIYRVRRRVAPYLEPTAEVPPRFIPGAARKRHVEVWRLARAGTPREEIAALFDYELATVTCILSGERTRRREEGEAEDALVVGRPSETKIRARHLKVWEMARSGLSRDEIAESSGYGPKWVERIILEERRRREAAGDSADDLVLPGFSAHTEAKARHAEVWAMAKSGVARELIAEHTGYALGTVTAVINSERVRRRAAGEPEADLQLPVAPDSAPFTPPGFWTEARTAQLIELYQAENGPTVIARIMGLRFGQVSSRLTVLQTEGRLVRARPSLTRDGVEVLYQDYWQSGLSLSAWCRQTERCRTTMSRHFREYGLAVPERKETDAARRARSHSAAAPSDAPAGSSPPA